MNKGKFAACAVDVLCDEMDHCLWSDDRRRWMIWDGRRWGPTTASRVQLEISKTLQNHWWREMNGYLTTPAPASSEPSPELLQNLADLITGATENLAYIKVTMRLLRTLDKFRTTADRWNEGQYLLNVQNGTVLGDF